jgi:hypothetical protein
LPSDEDTRWINLFFDIIEKAYLGDQFVYEKQTFRLEPTLVRPADFARRTFRAPLTSFEALLSKLNPTFKTLARSEVYRVKTGWIARGLKGFEGHKIRRIKVNGQRFLIPDLSKKPTIGIDTSGLGHDETAILVCSIPDYEGAYVFLEKHLRIPKDHCKNEFHWSRLNPECREDLISKFKLVRSICSDGFLVIKTNALNDRRGKIENLFGNLVEGCFSGYEKDPMQKNLRPALKRKFFTMINGTETHCDADFRPLTPDKVVRMLVQALAKKDGTGFERYTPSYAILRSHESKPIQISDILVGIIRTMIERGLPIESLQPLPFDIRKMKKYKRTPPKAYFWFP